MGGEGGEAGAPSAEPQSCLYPSSGLSLPPGTKDYPRQAYELSSPMTIEGLAAPWNELAAAYDVNGDAISDFLYLDETEPPRFRLAATGSMVAPFDTYDVDCEALQLLPAGRLLLRDLDDDQVPDFVIGTPFGVRAFVNEPQGVRQVLEFASPGLKGSLINVGTSDLDGDGRLDLVIGWDSVASLNDTGFSVTLAAFAQAADGSLAELGRRTAEYTFSARARDPYTGYFAVGNFDGAPSVVSIVIDDERTRFAVQTRFGEDDRDISLPEDIDDQVDFVFALPSRGAEDRLLAVGRVASYVLELAAGKVSVVTSQPLVFPGIHASHELGGGPESPRLFAYDIDRDGDLDFLETNAERTQLALRQNLDGQELDAAQLFDADVNGRSETPFIQLGPGSAIVAKARSQSPPAVYTLIRK